MAAEEKLQSPTFTGWAACAQLPCKQFANPLVLNENEIVLSPYGKNEYLRKYNIDKNRFDPYIPYPTEVNIKSHTIAIDKDTGKIFLYDGSDKIFVTFDIQKQMVTKCRKKKQSIVGNGRYSTSLVHDGTFHVIGGSEKDRHLVWDNMTQKFTEHDMPNPAPAGHASIVLPERGQIIVFGGNESVKMSKYMDTIFVCDLDPEISWRRLRGYKMPYRQWMFGCVVWKSIYVIIFGGKQKDKAVKDRNGLTDEIWILDLKTWEWKRCHMKCPKKAKFYAVKTDHDIVHLFEFDGDAGHWAIPVSMLVNEGLNKQKRKSLEHQVGDLTTKFTKVVVENEELVEAQKELKHKLKSLKSKNKQLVSENERLRDELEAMKALQSRRTNHNHDHVQSSLLKASNDYKALSAKYERLKALNTANGTHHNARNGKHNPQSPTPMHNSQQNHSKRRDRPQSAPINPFESNPFESFGDAAGDDDFWGDGNSGNNTSNNNGSNAVNGNKTGDDFLDFFN